MNVWWNSRRKESVYKKKDFNNTFHEFQVLKKVIRTETSNVDSHNKFVKFWIILFFQLSFILSALIFLFTYLYIDQRIFLYIYTLHLKLFGFEYSYLIQVFINEIFLFVLLFKF